jgi:hypothetical protein
MLLIYNLITLSIVSLHDALYILPDTWDIYVAPFIMIIAISGMCALVRYLSAVLFAVLLIAVLVHKFIKK